MKLRVHTILLCVLVIALCLYAEGCLGARLAGSTTGGAVTGAALGGPQGAVIGGVAGFVGGVIDWFCSLFSSHPSPTPIPWWADPWVLLRCALGWIVLIVVVRMIAHRFAWKLPRALLEALTIRPVRAVKTIRGTL